MKKVADQIAEFLKKIGVHHVFGIPSGPWTTFMNAFEAAGIDFVLVSNEASAGFMAEVSGRLTGVPGVCYGTLGPGATNLSTGVGGAFLDRSPLLAFTTEPPDSMMGRTTQMAIDHQALFQPITKWTTRLSEDRIEETLRRAVEIATSEVPGSVHIGLPADIGDKPALSEGFTPPTPKTVDPPQPDRIARLVELFRGARRPLLAVGLTAVRSKVGELIVRIAEQHRVPVVLTPMAKGLVPEDHPSYTGVLFHALSDIVAETNRQADLVIGVGYDPIEFNYEDWLPDVPLVHIDTAAVDIDRDRYTVALEVVGAITPTLQALAELKPEGKEWDFQALAGRRDRMFKQLSPNGERFGPVVALDLLRKMLPEQGVMTCDVGAHTHLIGQQWRTPAPNLQIMTNGWSSMGYGVPAAIGTKLCWPERPVVCVTGDGGFLMMAGEMATAKRLGLPIIFLVLVDRRLELIRIKQERKGYRRYGTFLHDEQYTSAGSLFGVPVISARSLAEYEKALNEAFTAEGPVVVEAFIDGEEYDGLILHKHK
ncbi:MAG: thiamine pyrophosphate-binding protein [Spirochaetaceae bacterium]|nr:MAG: thiamine pyrophosphate-binding protein [Spirochaetaceae bacterium]